MCDLDHTSRTKGRHLPLASPRGTLLLRLVVITLIASATSHELTITSSEDTVIRSVNESYFVTCHAPKAVRLMWIHLPSNQITAQRGRVHVEMSSNNEGQDLIFERIEMQDKGEYSCSGSIGGNEVSASFKLDVLHPLTFVDTPDVQYSAEGTNFVMRCDAEGEPEPIITIKKKNGLNNNKDKFKPVADGLVIHNVSLDDGGEYICRAVQLSPMKYRFQEKSILFKVEHPPQWGYGHMKMAYGFVGGTVNLTCTVSAEPPAEFQWMKDQQPIYSGDNVQILQEENRSILQLSVYNDSVFDEYVCRAINKMGSLETEIRLEEGNKPGRPRVQVKSTTADTVELQISDAPGEVLEILAYIVRYKDKENSDWSHAHNSDFPKGSPYILVGLRPETEYDVHVFARNAAGMGDPSAVMPVRTQPLQANPVTDLGSSSAMGTAPWPLLTLLLPIIFLYYTRSASHL